MLRLLFASVRMRLIALVLLAFLPGFGLISHWGLQERRIAITQAKEDALRLAKNASNFEKEIIDDARRTLFVLSQLPQLKQMDPISSLPILMALLNESQGYNALALVDSDGNIIISAPRTAYPVNVSDRPYYQRTRQTQDFVIGEYQVSRISGHPCIILAYPVNGEKGRQEATLIGELDLNWLNHLLSGSKLPKNASISVVDKSGVILARYPNPEQYVGRSLSESFPMEVLKADVEGVTEATGMDGVPRLYGFTSFGRTTEKLYIRVGVSKEAAFAEANGHLFRNLRLVGMIAFLILAATSLVGEKFILRWVGSLLKATKEVARGNLAARIGPSYASGELGELAKAFDKMAESIQAREAERNLAQEELEKAHQELEKRVEARTAELIDANVLLQQEIGERMRAEESFRKSEELLRKVLDTLPVGVWVTNKEGCVIMGNPAGRHIWGCSDRTGTHLYDGRKGWKEETGAPIGDDEWPMVRAAVQGETSLNETIEVECQDGMRKTILNSAVPIRDSNLQIMAVIVVDQDITQRKQTQDALKKLSGAVEQTADDILITDRNGVIEYVNPAFERHTGYTKEEMIGQKPGVLKSGKRDDDYYRRLWQKILAGDPFHDVIINRKKNGELYYEEETITPIRDVLNNITHFVAVGKDITERVRIEKALRESQTSLANAQRIARLGNWDWHIGENRLEWSDEVYAIFGLRREDFGGAFDGFLALVHPEERECVENAVFEALRSRKAYSLDHRIVRPDGAVRIVHEQAEICYDESGKPVRLSGTVQDITGRKRSEEKLRRSEQRYRSLVDAAPDIIYSLSAKAGKLTSLNPAFEKITGWSIREWIGKRSIQLVHPDDFSRAVEMFKDVMQGGTPQPYELRVLTKAGEYLDVEFTSAPQIENGVVTGEFGIARDVTDRNRGVEEQKRLEAQLRQAQKMEAIGALAGGIAHDFNNILAIILGYTELALLKAPKEAKLHGYLEDILRGSLRAKDLVSQILSFSRQKEHERKPLMMNLVLKETLRLLRATIPSTIEIRQDIESEAMIHADPTEVHQVLMNLCTNAAHSMKDRGGILEVNLTEADLDASFVARQPGVAPGRFLKMTVSDTGVGMDPGVVERIFEPYFTTKSQGEGTGLGLAVVHGIVKGLGGMVSAYSEEGKGSTFHVFLPKLESDESLEMDGPGALPTGKERILLVDDEEELVQAAADMLDFLGYDVVGSVRSKDALEIFRGNPEAFDLVITDLTMPEIGGLELAQELLSLRPGMPIILSTGFTQMRTMDQVKSIGIRELITKPIVISDLAGVVRRVLDGGAQGLAPSSG